MHDTEYHRADAEDTKRCTSADRVHQVAAEEATSRHSNALKNGADKTLRREIHQLWVGGENDRMRSHLKCGGRAMRGDDVRISGHRRVK